MNCQRAVIALLVLAAGGCRESKTVPTASDTVPVFVTIAPQAYFVQRIGGSHVTVDVLVGPGQAPHTYEPTPKQLARLAEARIYFRIGIAFEEPLVARIRATFKGVDIVDTREGVPLRTMTDVEAGAEEAEHEADTGHDAGAEHRNHAGHDAGAEHHDHAAHAAGETDPHIWLDPNLVKIQARTIAAALCRVDPANADDYQRNLAAFEADLDAVDRDLRTALAPLRGRRFYVYHPAYGYFADAYGLIQVPVEASGKQPGARQLAALIDHARREHVRLIFVEPQFPTESAKAVADAIGGAVVPLDPLARDYLDNLRDMAAKIRDALGAPATTPSTATAPPPPSTHDTRSTTP